MSDAKATEQGKTTKVHPTRIIEAISIFSSNDSLPAGCLMCSLTQNQYVKEYPDREWHIGSYYIPCRSDDET